MPYRGGPHQEIEIVMSLKYLNVFKPNEHTEDYHIRKPNDENFPFEIGDKTNFYVVEKAITFETNDKILKYFVDIGFNDFKFPYAYNKENIYSMLHLKFILIKKMKIQH